MKSKIIFLTFLIINNFFGQETNVQALKYNLLNECFFKSSNETTTLYYNSQSPILIENAEFKSNNINSTGFSTKICKIIVNATLNNENKNGSAYFMLALKLNSFCNNQTNQTSATYLSISDHSGKQDGNETEILEKSNVCDSFKSGNFILFESICFELNLIDLQPNASNINQYLNAFSSLDSITITSFNYVEKNECRSDEFRCETPSNVCISSKLKCDSISSCSDGSDEKNCVENLNSTSPSTTKYSSTNISKSTIEAQNSTIITESIKTTITTTITKTTTLITTILASSYTSAYLSTTTPASKTTTSFALIATNSTTEQTHLITIDSDTNKSKSYNFFIGILIILIFLSSVLIGVWFYGRRKRKWREFLAQLDNNTDWEYEQLDDGPTIRSAYSTTMSPVFNMNIDDPDNNQSNDYTYNIDQTNRTNNNNSINNNNNNNNSLINERTPVIA